MPLRVVCSECGFPLYEGGILKSPSDITKSYDGRFPKCGRGLSSSAEGLSIYHFEENNNSGREDAQARVRILFTFSGGGICNQDDAVMSQKCPILTNYYTDNKSKCIRYFVCNMQERTKDPRCPAKGQR